MALLPMHVHMARPCKVLVGIDEEPAKKGVTEFFVQFNAEIRRASTDEVIKKKKASVKHIGWNSSIMEQSVSVAVQGLLVPMESRRSVGEKIMIEAFQAALRPSPYASGGKSVRMWVDIGLSVIDVYYEPRFVPASTMSIEKLERTRIQVPSTVCSVYMEEMAVGSEATKMPCSHLYHEACIVDWLQQSGICPLCKFRLPN